MYSESDDDDDNLPAVLPTIVTAPVLSAKAAHTADTHHHDPCAKDLIDESEGGGFGRHRKTPVDAAGLTPSPTSDQSAAATTSFGTPTEEDPSISVHYLERCAILVDSSLLLPQESKSPMQRVVERQFTIVHYPLCLNHNLTAMSHGAILQPEVPLKNLSRSQKKDLLSTIKLQVTRGHGVCPHYRNDGENEFKDFKPPAHYRTALKAAVDAHDGRENFDVCLTQEAVATQKTPLERLIKIASDAATEDDDKPALAFLTPRDRRLRVLRMLHDAQEQHQLVLPPFRVFTLEDVVGEGWARLCRPEANLSCACRFHKKVGRNSINKPFYCCKQTVAGMMYTLAKGAAALNNVDPQADAVFEAPAQPIVEDE